MKTVRELKTGRLVKTFQYYWVDEGDCCEPGTRVQGSYQDDPDSCVSLDPGEWEEVN